MTPATSRHDRRSAPTSSSGVSRVLAIAGVAFLSGVAFHTVIARDRPDTLAAAARTSAASGHDSGAMAIGPTQIVEGVPAGFAPTEGGAVAAAVSFVTTGQALIDMNPLAVEAAVRQMASEATADLQVVAVLGDLRRLRDTLSGGTGPITFRQAAVAARLGQFESGRAQVDVWNVGVLSRDGIAAPQAGWQVSKFDLVWERGDWRIDTETINSGPAPSLDRSSTPVSSAQLASMLDGFVPLATTPSINGINR